MKSLTKTIIIILIILVAWFILRFVIGGPEDDWICVDDEWVKHGMPAQPMPTTGCGDDRIIENFDDCLAAGFPAMESYPRQCRDDQDNHFIEDIGNELEKMDLIRIDSPRPNQQVASPLVIQGQARGYWFFEGDFPIVLVNWDGLIIAEGYATAQTDWMVEDFVPFEAELEFEADTTVSDRGALILQKDNPSGLPENDDALEVPVKF